MEGDEISLENKSLGEAEHARIAGQGTGKVITASDLHATLRRLKLWLGFLGGMIGVLLIVIIIIGIFAELESDYLDARIGSLEGFVGLQVIWTANDTPPSGYFSAGTVLLYIKP